MTIIYKTDYPEKISNKKMHSLSLHWNM